MAIPRPVPAALCLLAALAPSAVGQEPPFRAPIVQVGGMPQSLVAGDLDGDGDLDVVVASADDTLIVALNQGDGTWLPGALLITGTGLERMALGDLDADGDLDLVHALDGPVNELLVVRLNDGAGAFGPAVGYPTSPGPRDVDLADLDGDGDLDAVLPCLVGQRVSVLRNQGDGTFGPKTDVGAGVQPLSTALGDWNGDGAIDAAVAGNGTGAADRTVTLLLNDGTGQLSASGTITLPTRLYDIGTGDLDADGQPDLVVGTDTGAQVWVLFGAGGGAFEPAQSVAAVLDARQLDVADLDEDGDDDVVTNSGAGTNDVLCVLLSRGDGSFDPPARYGCAGTTTEVLVADLTGDGDLDLAAPGAEFIFGTWFTILEGRGDGSFGPFVGIAGDNAPDAAFGDMDGDGRDDLVAGSNLNGTLSVVPGRGSGFFGGAVGFATSQDGQLAGRPQRVAVADFDGDGRLDVAAGMGNTGAPRLDVLHGDGALGFDAIDVVPIPTPCTDLAAVDLDGDGDADLLATGGLNSTLMVLLNDGTGVFPTLDLYPTSSSPVALATAHLDADGRLDVVVATAGTSPVVHTYLGQPGGTLGDPLSFVSGLVLTSVDAADLDGDGDADVVAAAGPSVQVFLGSGDGFLGAPSVLGLTGTSAQGVVARDLDGDGLVDIAAGCDGTSPFSGLGSLSFLRGLGGGAFAPAAAVTSPANVLGLLAHDVDGDGALDLAAPALDDYVAIWRNTGGPWSSLGAALPGSLGPPKLVGEGPLTPGSTVRLTITDTRANGAGSLYLGLSALNANFKGGLMVPNPLLKFGPVPVDASGDLELSATWPPGPSLDLYMQFWFVDPEGPVGFASTNALLAEVP